MPSSPISNLRVSKKHPLLRLLGHAKNYRSPVWIAVICTILNQLFDLAPSYFIGVAVDVVVEKENSLIAQIGITSIVGQLVVLSLLTLLVWSLESLFKFLYNRLWRNLAQTIQHELRLDTYTHLQQLELSYFEERSTGELLSILNDDINQLERFLNFGLLLLLLSQFCLFLSFFGVHLLFKNNLLPVM